MPFDGYLGDDVDTIEVLARYLEDTSSGLDKPAAAIVETVQAEGGVNVARFDWLERLAALLAEHEVLLIVDDIQVGCGRTGPFFSFEPAGIQPDIVCLSKSLSGYGLPFAIDLIKPHLDVWDPGEHNGTFRGHNPAFVTAVEALSYWEDDALNKEVEAKAATALERLERIAASHPDAGLAVRGRGLIQGLVFDDPDLPARVSEECFENGLIIETAGRDGEVLKLLPPLTITEEALAEGLDIIESAVAAVLSGDAPKMPDSAEDPREGAGMIVRRLEEIEGTDRDVTAETFASRRFLLKKDGLGFSFHDTVLYAGTETYIWYKNHLEAVYCMGGEGELEDLDNGVTHEIRPGTFYALDGHERHYLRAKTDLRMMCVFSPALTGEEVHDEEGAYPLLETDEPMAVAE